MESFRKPAYGLPNPGFEPAQFKDLLRAFFIFSILSIPESAGSLFPWAGLRPFVEGQIAGDRHEPGREGGPPFRVKTVDISVGPQECFLGQILTDLFGKREILQIEENHPLVTKDKDLEGFRVSLSGLFDKKPVIHELCVFPFHSIIPFEPQKVPRLSARSSQPRILDTRPGPDYALFTARGVDLERNAGPFHAQRKRTIPVRRTFSTREAIRKKLARWDNACGVKDGARL